MRRLSSNIQQYKALLMLGVPIVIGQVGVIILGFADTLMIGQHSTVELAAASLVNTIFQLFLIFSLGYSFGLTPMVGDNFARNDRRKAGELVKNSLAANTVLSLIVMAILATIYFNLDKMGQPEELLPVMRPYYLVNFISVPFVLWFNCLKQFCDAITDTRTPMWILLGGNVINIVCNYILIFGKLGFPEMGLLGAGLATMGSRIIMFMVIFALFMYKKKYAEFYKGFKEGSVTKTDLRHVNSMGIPPAFQMGMEIAAFSLSGIMVGWLGTEALAAHQITLTTAQICYMTYYGMSAAVAVRVSYFKGQRDYRQLNLTARCGFNLIFVMAFITCVPLLIFRDDIGGIFTDNAEVSSYVAAAIYPLMIYQFGDALQCNYSNALRGISVVKPLMYIAFIAYFVISLPMSYILGIHYNFGLVGIWTAFPFALTIAGIMYYTIFKKETSKFNAER